MMMLRQKIQITMARNCQKESVGTTETRHIESEMMRVQTLLEDLQRRRIELSHQVHDKLKYIKVLKDTNYVL